MRNPFRRGSWGRVSVGSVITIYGRVRKIDPLVWGKPSVGRGPVCKRPVMSESCVG